MPHGLNPGVTFTKAQQRFNSFTLIKLKMRGRIDARYSIDFSESILSYFYTSQLQYLQLLYSLDECTKSTSLALDPEAVDKFCKAVDNDLDGPSTAARLLGHKIQSPQQQESLNALCVSILHADYHKVYAHLLASVTQFCVLASLTMVLGPTNNVFNAFQCKYSGALKG